MPAKIHSTEEQIKKVKELFNLGYGARKIAKELCIGRWQVQSIYKILGIYNIGRKNQRTVYLAIEKYCRKCEKTKPILQFRKRYNKRTDRHSYETYCLDCERDYNNIRQNNRIKKRLKEDPAFRLRKNISWSIWHHLKSHGSSKKGKSCLKYLPYTFQELKQHIESLFEPWMNWNNIGIYNPNAWNDSDESTWTWQVDHIIPQSDLPYENMSDENFKKCWALENLRPLSAKLNNLDGVRRLRHKLM